MSSAAMSEYPVTVSAAQPARFQRIHLLLRIALWFLLGSLFNGVVLLAGAIISAALASQRGDRRFHERYGDTYAKVVAFVTALQGYMFFAGDDLPMWGESGTIRYDYRPTGEPTVGSALLRIVMVIPHVIALWIVGIVAFVVGLIAAVSVLLNESVSHGVWKFLMGYVAWEARVLTYYLSMVEEYPPFSLDVEERDPEPRDPRT